MKLRAYQTDIIDRARAQLRQHRRVLIQAPTGAGKTALTAAMLGTAAARGKRSWFVVHRAELLDQSIATFEEVGIAHGLVAAGREPNPYMPVQLCSVDTLRNRIARLSPPDLVVWDEAHHIAAATWGAIQDRLPSARHIGLTATPERLDGKGLHAHFDALVLGPEVRWLIDQGYLCEYRLFAPAIPDLDTVKRKAGDFDRGQLASIMDTSRIVGDAISHYRRVAPGRRAIVFCVSIEHSRHVVAEFGQAGFSAVHIDGTMARADRKAAIDAFRAGDIQVLSNVDLVGEGFDLPAIEVAILLRPTQSLGLYLQQVGRSLRPDAGKQRAIILDHAGNALRHGLPDDPRPWTLEDKPRPRRGKGEVAGPPVRQCPNCYAVHRIAPVCPECGHRHPVQARPLKVEDGNLEEVKREDFARRRRAMSEQAQAQSLDALIELGYRRGYRNPEAWAAHIATGRMAKQRGAR